MANFSSDEYAIVSTPPVSAPLDPTQDKGRIRLAHFNWAALTAAAADVLFFCRLPAGKCRVLRMHAKRSAWGAGATLAIGHNGYTNRQTGAAVAASANAFLAAFAMDAATDLNSLIDIAIDSRGGFDVTGTIAVAGATAETLSGYFEYVVD